MRITTLSAVLCAIALTTPAVHAQDSMPEFLAGKSFQTVAMTASGDTVDVNFEFADQIDPDQPSRSSAPDAGCASNLYAVEHSQDRVLFKQRLAEGEGRCFDLGYVEVRNDPVAGAPVYRYALLRVMAPVFSSGVLFETRETPTRRDIMEGLSRRLTNLEREPVIVGFWGFAAQSLSHFAGRSCSPMVDEGPPWLPMNSVGRLVIWAVPSEAGGQIFLAYVDNENWSGLMADPVNADQIKAVELRHVSDGMFSAPDGFFIFEGEHFIYAQRHPVSGERQLVVARPGQDSRRTTIYEACK